MNSMEEGLETMEELQDGEEICDMLSSGYNMSHARINTQHLWLPAQELHKFRAVKISSAQVEELLEIGGC